MQIERLVQMIFYLVDHSQVTAKELAEVFQVSTRTIYRDINTLTLAGIPVMSIKGSGGGISLLEGYTLDKSLLTKEEQQQIYQGLQILQAANYPNAETALSKISALFQQTLQPQWLEVDFSYWGSDRQEKLKISDLQAAIINKQSIAFDYVNSELEKSHRIIEPLRLVFKSHAWYIVGFCQKRQEIRIFRLNRIKDLSLQPEMFERELPADFSLKSQPVENLPTVKLRFSSQAIHRLYDEFAEEQLLPEKDGSYLIMFEAELNNWLVHYLLSFGKQVEVLAPTKLRAMLQEQVEAIAKLYKK